MAQIPTWLEHLKSEMKAGRTLHEANLSYYETYFPDRLAQAMEIMDKAIASASATIEPLPPESEFLYEGESASKQLLFDVLFSQL